MAESEQDDIDAEAIYRLEEEIVPLFTSGIGTGF
jgi:hypothetical protein